VLFGPVASTSTAWRVLDRVSEAHLSKLRAGRATARALFRSWPCRRNSSLVDLKRAFALVFALVCRIQLVPVASGWLLDLFADLRKLPVGALPAPSFPVPGLIMSPLL
jgi:hypothetical protein